MHKKIIFLIMLILITSFSNVNAETIFENKNGVVLTNCEFEFVTKLFWDGFQDDMTINDYNNIFSNGINCYINVEQNSDYNLLGDTHTTANKKLNISKACTGSNCLITTTLNWLNLPIVRSYDVIGAYLNSTSLVNDNVTTYLYDGNSTIASNEIKYDTNGFGVSIKLPSSASSLTIVQYFTVSQVGTVYASYQHAVSSISLANSKKYSISRSGYGGVLLFEESIRSKYDAMNGVNISL